MEKKDIALRQLRTAARLYKQGDYVSSLTLSAAAEEILGKIAKRRIGKNELDKEIMYLGSIHEYYSKSKPNNKTLIKSINKIKNELKHNDLGENSWVDADFEFEAVSLFVKAVKNYFNAYNEMPKDRIINGLFDFLTL